MLCEGQSTRATAQPAEVSCNTVAKLWVDAGTVCPDLHGELVQDVTASRNQCDQGWSLRQGLQKAQETPGPTALDRESEPIVAWLISGRDGDDATAFMDSSSRPPGASRLTATGSEAIEDAFGADVDCAQLVQLGT